VKKTIPFLSIIAKSKGKIDFQKKSISEISPDEFVVKSIVSGISAGTERKTILGDVPSFSKHWNKKLRIYEENNDTKKFPVNLGYETIGKVEKIGKNVKEVKIGDLLWVDGPHSQYSLLNEKDHTYIKLPKKISPNKATFLPLTRVALGAIHDAKIKVGDIVVVIGQGIVGSLVAQIAQISGAKVIVVDMIKERLEVSANIGFDTINSKEILDPAAYLRNELNYSNGADVVIESSGSYSGLKTAIRMATKQGLVVTVGSYPTTNVLMNLGEEWQKNKISLISSMTINGCLHPNHPLWDLDRLNKTALNLLHTERINTDHLISHTIPFLNAQDAYKLILANPPQGLKILLTYENNS